MNSCTVIFSNMGDTDTLVLKHIWEGLPNVKVIEVNNHNGPWAKKVDSAILAEKDTLILCGHGYPSGLLSPQMHGEQFLVSEGTCATSRRNTSSESGVTHRRSPRVST